MSDYYFWLRLEDGKYYISDKPCIRCDTEDGYTLQLVRDIDFSIQTNLNKETRLILVSYPNDISINGAYLAISKHFIDNVRDDKVSIVYTVNIKLPESVENFYIDNSDLYDISECDFSKSIWRLKINMSNFKITLNYRKIDDKDSKIKEHYYLSHPFIKM